MVRGLNGRLVAQLAPASVVVVAAAAAAVAGRRSFAQPEETSQSPFLCRMI